MVLTKLLKLNAWKSCGKDEVHAYLLKELAHEICPALTAIYNSSLVSGVVPLDWRFATISPIFKKGSKKLAENYRPVPLTSVACKILESFVREKLICFLKENKLLSEKQFGFLGQRSTILQLLNYLDYCGEAMGKGQSVDSIYLDFQKAFDTVPQRRLIEKLKAYGISESLLKWIHSFLSMQKQQVSVNGCLSSEQSVISGVVVVVWGSIRLHCEAAAKSSCKARRSWWVHAPVPPYPRWLFQISSVVPLPSARIW